MENFLNIILIDTTKLSEWINGPPVIRLDHGMILLGLLLIAMSHLILPLVSGYGYRIWNVFVIVFFFFAAFVYWKNFVG